MGNTGTTPKPPEPAAQAGKPTKKAETDTRVSLDKASGAFKPVLKWLLDQPPEVKLAAVAFSVLTSGGDASGFIQQAELYDGDMEQLRRDWKDEVLALPIDGVTGAVVTLIATVDAAY